MKPLRTALLALALLAFALPTPASAARTKRCEGIGNTITMLRSKGRPCDEARTLAAMWAETVASGGDRIEQIDDFRCVRSNPPGPGGAVRCARDGGATVVTFRYRL
ncbi:MAG TPA: hypothetical protein VF259_01000 [Solirubrobacterales bacterium]